MSEGLVARLVQPGALRCFFQPIYRVGRRGTEIHALECLTRGPADTNMENPGVLFDYLRRKGEEALFDRMCITNALRDAAGLPSVSLNLNVHASTLGKDAGFADFLQLAADHAAIPVDRLTVEIVEHSPFHDDTAFGRQIAALREMGVCIALDDVGLGHSNYKMILQVRPEVFKIDRFLVELCHLDAARRAILASVRSLAQSLGAIVVAEGIELQEELDAVVELGIEHVQGYLFCRPMPAARLAEVPIWAMDQERARSAAGGA